MWRGNWLSKHGSKAKARVIAVLLQQRWCCGDMGEQKRQRKYRAGNKTVKRRIDVKLYDGAAESLG